MEIVRRTLRDAKLGQARSCANLAVFPLWTQPAGDRPYWTLDEALASGQIRVTEVSEGGSVPELCLVNTSDRPVLLLDGEELRGAKQNRVLNLTILAPAGKTIVVPVSCVERGRWAYKTAQFERSDHVLYAQSRAVMSDFVSASLSRDGKPRSDQGGVWRSIAEKSARLGTRSKTDAMEDIYLSRRDAIERFVRGLALEPGQTGAVFALDGHIKGAEVFEHPEALARVFPKLVRSWALDAIESPPGEVPAAPPEAARAFLDEIAEAEMTSFPAVGQGTDVRVASARATGGALVDAGRVVHLSAFRKAK